MGGEPSRPKGLRVRTACATVDEFVAMYRDDCDEASVFTATEKMIPADAPCAFSIELADGEPMLRGLGIAIASWPTTDGPFGRAGVHISIDQLTSGTQPIFQRLLDARSPHARRRRPAPVTQQRFPIEVTETDLMPEEESLIRDVRRTITREMQAASPDSGAPVAEIDERTSQTTRFDGPLRAPALPAARIAGDTLRPPAFPARLPLPAPPNRPSAPALGEPWAAPPARPLPEPSPEPAPPRTPRSSSGLDPVRAWLAPRLRPISTRLSPVTSRLAALLRAIARRLAPATTWLAARLAPLKVRVVRAFGTPPATAPWWRNARVASVFASGIVLGLLAGVWSRPSAPRAATPIASTASAPCGPDKVAIATAPRATAPVASAPSPQVASTGKRAPVKPATPTKASAAAPVKSPALATSKPASPVASKATTPTTAAKPAALATTKPASTAATKPTTAAKPASPVASTATTPPKPATATKPAAQTPAVATNRPKAPPPKKKGGCSTLDCI